MSNENDLPVGGSAIDEHMSSGNDTPAGDTIDEREYEAAVREAENGRDTYVHVFARPFTFEGESIDSLTFDFGTLTAADALTIESELAAQGRAVITPEFSGDFLMHMAMRACTYRRADGRRLGIDAFRTLPLAAFIRIRGRARSFLLRAES